jgi:hypothetical protein
MFLGENLLAWLVLAIGAAMAAGNLWSLIRPPDQVRASRIPSGSPTFRTVIQVILGVIVALWATITLIATR